MVIAATLVMIVTLTFRIPYGAFGAIYALTISRESTQATVTSVVDLIIAFAAGTAYVLIGALFFIDDPLLRLLWVIGTFFAMFYVVSAMTDYGASARFGYLMIITTPLWDQHISAELRVEGTLWAVAATVSASLITVIVELVFAELRPGDDLIHMISERLTAIEHRLARYIANQEPDPSEDSNITRLSMLGTSGMRRILQRTNYSPLYREEMGAVVALVGRLVDLAAGLTYLNIPRSGENQERIRHLAEHIAVVRSDLENARAPRRIEPAPSDKALPPIPLVHEMETTLSLIPEALAGPQALNLYAAPPLVKESPKGIFVSDAFSNPVHFHFGLKGCLAATICYITYNALFWPGISTSVTTCFLTALTTVGASHQKQFLRFGGALVGGFGFGLGAQIFILPSLDSIASFTVLFVTVAAISSWIATSTPRLSYFGVQVAVAFCLITLSDFKFETSLVTARDRVVGVLLGLVVMWLVFDQLWSAPAGVEMRKKFINTLRLLADLTREPGSQDTKLAVAHSYGLRDTINRNFDEVKSLADGVLFEFGSSRHSDLAWRSGIRQWQPELRTYFAIRNALLKYRLRLPGFELPEAVQTAQLELDEQLAARLDAMADRLEGKAASAAGGVEVQSLEQAVLALQSQAVSESLIAHSSTVVHLSRRVGRLIVSLDSHVTPPDSGPLT